MASRVGTIEQSVRWRTIGETAERAGAELARDVSRAYFGLRLALESERVLGEVRSVYREIVADRERAFHAGAVNLESVLNARSQMQGLEAQWAVATQARRSADAGLRFLLGSAESIVPVDSWREILPPLNAQEIIERARRWNPDLRTLDLQVSHATTFAQIQKSCELLRPDLALSVGVEASGQRDAATREASLTAELEAAVAVYAVESALLDLEHLSGDTLR